MVTPLLENLLGHNIENFRNPDETSADGAILFVQSGTQVPILLFKLQDEIGTGDADATHEVGLLYRKVWSQKEVYHSSLPAHQGSQSRVSCCPAFLFAIVRSWLCVPGPEFADKGIIRSLTP